MLKFNKNILLFIFIILISCKKENNDYLKGHWKNCGENPGFSDILVFDEKYNSVRNDTIFSHKDSAIAIVEKISHEYGEPKLYLKSIKDQKIYRFCKK
ncbi:hypothetical protein IX39_20130 [Chryseobacterium formosense]|uniref:Lipoprotein n=1 Tax=Chryseobacterium formosense TaxID=236814 RepID=A0A085YYQ0_9FLAO|nr:MULTISPECIES: hypothetical protein [Chryseobacterium]KFE97313.1 hypothetical protein IX39_20130 [Chryseobacterium formosense]OCK50302.1 hypothetical protein BA768_20415 [Chryseobacterium sp. CBo1]